MSTQGRYPGFFSRLRFYLIGLAIGLMMLGFFQLSKRNEAARNQAQAERAGPPKQPANDPLFPPLPGGELKK
ncbi:MAG TPA: hypothetical protein VD997_09505 [Phycisphaerales bacterium]|nr:hypothetical protein [Phycisphaerales bacterium]